MRILKNTVAAAVVLAATTGLIVSTGVGAFADGGPTGGPTPSNWHCC